MKRYQTLVIPLNAFKNVNNGCDQFIPPSLFVRLEQSFVPFVVEGAFRRMCMSPSMY